jgi:hypothetical protein
LAATDRLNTLLLKIGIVSQFPLKSAARRMVNRRKTARSPCIAIARDSAFVPFSMFCLARFSTEGFPHDAGI